MFFTKWFDTSKKKSLILIVITHSLYIIFLSFQLKYFLKNTKPLFDYFDETLIRLKNIKKKS